MLCGCNFRAGLRQAEMKQRRWPCRWFHSVPDVELHDSAEEGPKRMFNPNNRPLRVPLKLPSPLRCQFYSSTAHVQSAMCLVSLWWDTRSQDSSCKTNDYSQSQGRPIFWLSSKCSHVVGWVMAPRDVHVLILDTSNMWPYMATRTLKIWICWGSWNGQMILNFPDRINGIKEFLLEAGGRWGPKKEVWWCKEEAGVIWGRGHKPRNAGSL